MTTVSELIPRNDLERLFRIGLAFGSERKKGRLVERILLEAKEVANADGGTLYLRTDDEKLCFQILVNDSLKLAIGLEEGCSPQFEQIPLFKPGTFEENHDHVAAHVVHIGDSVHVPDAYSADSFNFEGTRAFDSERGYRTASLLTLPMKNLQDRVIGVLQLVNARDEQGKIVPFADRHQVVVGALAAQAAVALDAQQLYSSQKALLSSFLELLAAAIDHKSPYTGEHCRRVPVLTEMLVRAMAAASEGAYAEFNPTDEQWEELHVASLLHDCGKVTTPAHVMDKATKLEGLLEGMELVEARLSARARGIEARAMLEGRDPQSELDELREHQVFLRRVNMGGEAMAPEDEARVKTIAALTYVDVEGREQPMLRAEEVDKLCISRGTLTPQERLIINGHMVQTVLMLDALPFPRDLKNVPEIACGHHERMDGQGYPRGIYAGDMSLCARAMAIADVFEALTAGDRPYKPAMPLSKSMAIMGKMKVNNHLDPELFDFFVRSGVYRRYAERYLPRKLCDDVDEKALIALEPNSFELPPKEERDKRWDCFLPAYQAMVPESKP